MVNNIKNILFFICIFFISFFIIFGLIYFSQWSCFFDDDSWFAIYKPDEGYFDCLWGSTRFQHGGYYIGLAMCKFFSFGLPILLSIHPGDFITWGAGFIKGIFTIITLLLLTRFSVFKSKSKLIYLIMFFFLTCYFFANAIYSVIMTINYRFYRYFFSLCFFSIFYYYIYKNILLTSCSNHLNKRDLFLLTGVILSGFIYGTSVEIGFYIAICLYFLIILYNLVINFIIFLTKNKNLQFYKYKLDMKFYLPGLGLLTGIILFVARPSSIDIMSERGLFNFINNITIDNLKEFIQLYFFQVCFKEQIVYWIIFIFLIYISFFIAYKKGEIKDVIFPLLMEISIITIMFSLVLLGKEHDSTYFYTHRNIIFLFKMLIIFPLLIYFDYLLHNIPNKFKIYCSFLLFVFVVCITIYYVNKIVNLDSSWTFFNDLLYEKRLQYYIMEKIHRFYMLKNEKPILPDYYDENLDGFAFYPYYTPDGDMPMSSYVSKYYLLVYKVEQEGEYYISKNALNKFYEKGGIIKEEELKDIKFSRLFDEKFVLNEI